MISLHFQGKPFNTTVIQVYALTSNAKEAEVEWFYEDRQDLLGLTPKKDALFIIGDWNAKEGSKKNTSRNRQICPWSTERSRAKANSILPREHTGLRKHPFQQHKRRLHMDITRWSIPEITYNFPIIQMLYLLTY